MILDEFLAWEPGDGRMWQLVDGEPRRMPVANVSHAALHAEVGAVVGNHVRGLHGPGLVSINVGVVPRVYASHNLRIPKLAVTSSRLGPEAFLSDPLLLIELLSPENKADTCANVWAYTSIPSVQEIVVLHTTSVAADLLRRDVEGIWPPNPKRVVDGPLVLDSIGLSLELASLYRTTCLNGPVEHLV